MPIVIPFDFAVTSQGKNTFARPPAQWVDVRLLPAGGATVEHSLPAGVQGGVIVIFSADGDFWASPYQSSTPPTAAIIDGTAPEFNPVAWLMDWSQSINLSANEATLVHMYIYSAPFFK